jgi:hypothetical protein
MFDQQARDRMGAYVFHDDDEQPDVVRERLKYNNIIEKSIQDMFDAQQKARERARLTKGPTAQVDVLQFWKEHCLEFRPQNVMVLKYLGIPARSATVERLFSKTSFILRKHRRSMSEKLAQQLFFLKENYYLING